MVSIDDFATEVMQALMDYDNEVESTMQTEVDKTAREALKLLKTHPNIPEKTGAYKKSFKIKKLAQGRGYNRKLLYAANGEHRKTHLLENGHLTRKGTSRTRAFPHWADAQKMADELYEEMQRKLKQ